MSKGPGRVQRAIEAAFKAEPDNAFTTAELCHRTYRLKFRDDAYIELKHRVAVVRAAKKIPNLNYVVSCCLGGQLVFYDKFNVMSYGMARLKADNVENYRNNDPRLRYGHKSTEAGLRARLADDQHRQLMAKDGAWWRHVEIAKAEAQGDKKRAAQLRALAEAELKKYLQTVRWMAQAEPRHRPRHGVSRTDDAKQVVSDGEFAYR